MNFLKIWVFQVPLFGNHYLKTNGPVHGLVHPQTHSHFPVQSSSWQKDHTGLSFDIFKF